MRHSQQTSRFHAGKLHSSATLFQIKSCLDFPCLIRSHAKRVDGARKFEHRTTGLHGASNTSPRQRASAISTSAARNWQSPTAASSFLRPLSDLYYMIEVGSKDTEPMERTRIYSTKTQQKECLRISRGITDVVWRPIVSSGGHCFQLRSVSASLRDTKLLSQNSFPQILSDVSSISSSSSISRSVATS